LPHHHIFRNAIGLIMIPPRIENAARNRPVCHTEAATRRTRV